MSLEGTPLVLAGIALLAGVTFTFKAVGPVTAAGRPIAPRLQVAIGLLPTALIAGLVVTQTVDPQLLRTGALLDARLLGVLAAVIAVALRAPFALVVLVGSAVAAIARLAGIA